MIIMIKHKIFLEYSRLRLRDPPVNWVKLPSDQSDPIKWRVWSQLYFITNTRNSFCEYVYYLIILKYNK